jgi:uncharacterized protein (TIGR02996 family)
MDDALRELERLAAQGDPGALERLEAARRRAGLGRTPVPAPPLGESVTEVTVAEWHVAEGDRVQRDQVIAILETDKVCVDLVAPEDGVVAALAVPEGEVAPVGAPLAQLAPLLPLAPEVEARHDALLAAIVAAPDDVAPRLDYADFLVDTAARGLGVRRWGPETTARRGQLIRRHHQGGAALDAQGRLWLPRLTRTALDLVPFQVPGARVEGGFVSGINAPAAWVVRRWAELVERAPITDLGLTDLADAAPVLALPRLEQVRSLTLGLRVSAPALEALAASGRLRVRRLVLPGGPAVPALAALAAPGRFELAVEAATEAPLRELLTAIPAAVTEVHARVRVAGMTVTEESLLEMIGPRYVRRGPR